MIYIIGLRLCESNVGEQFTSVHVEADNIKDAIDLAQKESNQLGFGDGRMVVCSAKESFLKILRKEG